MDTSIYLLKCLLMLFLFSIIIIIITMLSNPFLDIKSILQLEYIICRVPEYIFKYSLGPVGDKCSLVQIQHGETLLGTTFTFDQTWMHFFFDNLQSLKLWGCHFYTLEYPI